MTPGQPYESFAQRVARVVKSIPKGKVATYGQVARIAGNPRAARQVVRALRAMSEKHGLPWHRVISSKGIVSLPGEGGRIQRQLLEGEGVRFDPAHRISLRQFQWQQ